MPNYSNSYKSQTGNHEIKEAHAHALYDGDSYNIQGVPQSGKNRYYFMEAIKNYVLFI